MAIRSIPLVALILITGSARAGETIDPGRAKQEAGSPTLWYDVKLLGLEGQPWTETKAPFDRLPSKAEGTVRPPVWSLSRNSAGLCARFVTDAPRIEARWSLTSDRLAMPHMAATGVSGLDLYVRSPEGRWRWLAVGQPRAVTNTATLVSGLPPGRHEFLLYLPLYNGVKMVELGLPPGTTLVKADERPAGHRKPIVFYGTSITQGGCASRPGMVHTAILGRKLDQPVVNLGFSGNGTMDPSMADLLAEIDAAIYVIDCLPNMTAEQVAERTEPLVQTLRKAHPDAPIVLAEDRTYSNAHLLASPRNRNETSRAALRAAFDRLKKAGVSELYLLPGEPQLGDDAEGTVDGSHPTDLGFLRMAEAFETVLAPLLKRP